MTTPTPRDRFAAATILGDVARQIEDAIHDRIVVALDAVGMVDLADMARLRAANTAVDLAMQLCQTTDDHLAAQTVIDLTGTLWDENPEPAWWRTPLGRVVARSVGHHDTEAVSYSVAAAMLGVTRGTVSQWVHRGTLDRHPDGGVLRASVLQRLAR